MSTKGKCDLCGGPYTTSLTQWSTEKGAYETLCFVCVRKGRAAMKSEKKEFEYFITINDLLVLETCLEEINIGMALMMRLDHKTKRAINASELYGVRAKIKSIADSIRSQIDVADEYKYALPR